MHNTPCPLSLRLVYQPLTCSVKALISARRLLHTGLYTRIPARSLLRILARRLLRIDSDTCLYTRIQSRRLLRIDSDTGLETRIPARRLLCIDSDTGLDTRIQAEEGGVSHMHV